MRPIQSIFSPFVIIIGSLLPCWSQSTNTIDHHPIYFQIPASPISCLTNGAIVAIVNDADGEIVGCALYDGELPPGVTLAKDGSLIVTSQERLKGGTYQFDIFTVDEKRGLSTTKLVLTILSEGLPNAPSQTRILPLKPLYLYKQHDVLAKVWDLDGSIIRTQFVRGELPPGTQLTQQGELLVKDPQALKPDIYEFTILVEDRKGGASFVAITLSFSTRETASHLGGY